MTIANVWPGAGVTLGGHEFRIKAVKHPHLQLLSPEGTQLIARVCDQRVIDGVTAPQPGRFCTTSTHKPYRIADGSVWGHVGTADLTETVEVACGLHLTDWNPMRCRRPAPSPNSSPYLLPAATAIPRPARPACALASKSGGISGAFPPFTKYVVGSGWLHLPGYYRHRMTRLTGDPLPPS